MTRTAAILLILGALLLVAGVGMAIDIPAAMILGGALVGFAGVMSLERKEPRR